MDLHEFVAAVEQIVPTCHENLQARWIEYVVFFCLNIFLSLSSLWPRKINHSKVHQAMRQFRDYKRVEPWPGRICKDWGFFEYLKHDTVSFIFHCTASRSMWYIPFTGRKLLWCFPNAPGWISSKIPLLVTTSFHDNITKADSCQSIIGYLMLAFPLILFGAISPTSPLWAQEALN
jgi:hypothetical protein